MSDDAVDERALGDELERLTPAPDAGWSARLGTTLEHERLRRGVASRPTHLWLRAVAAGLVGVVLLLVALAQA